MRTIKKAQDGGRVGRARGQKCGFEKAQRKEERYYERLNRQADRQADREARREARKAPRAKQGGSFPDLNKDGKITKADILKGRGVIAKKGVALKKQAAVAIAMKKAGKSPKKARGGATLSPSTSSVSKRLGSSKKLRGGGTLAPTKSSTSRRLSSAHTRKAMGGMKMGKCKYGC